MRILTTFVPAPVVVLAAAVQERLGANFYTFLDAYPVLLEDGLFVQTSGQLDFTDQLESSGYKRGLHYGIGYPGGPQFVPCAGVIYDTTHYLSLHLVEPWTEECLPEAVRAEREALNEARRFAYRRLEQAKLDAACDIAEAEGIPHDLVLWARKQPSALHEINEIQQSVSRLRAAGCCETKIAEALGSQHFLQALFKLKKEAQISERALRWP